MRIVGVALAALLSSSAGAQDGSFQLERFRSAVDRGGFFDVEGAVVSGDLDVDAAVVVGYEANPLVLQVNGSDRGGALVGRKLTSNVVAAIGLFDVVEVGIDVPVVLFQQALITDPFLLSIAQPLPATALGDVRLAPKVQVLRQRDLFVDVAVMPGFTVPTNTPAGSFAGDALPTFLPEVLVGRSFLGASDVDGPLRVDANLGFRFRSPAKLLDLDVGQEFTWRASVNDRFDVGVPVRVGVNVSGAVGLDGGFDNVNGNPVELGAGATFDVGDSFVVGANAGVGVIGGAGTPDWRVMGLVRWSPRAPKDADGDGVIVDACEGSAEDRDGFEDDDGCPDTDNDQDGVLDAADLAPNEPEDRDGFDDADGKADPDNDGDGVFDGVDVCRDVAGTAAGCPDQDGDGIADKNDKCVDQAEMKNGLADDDGCPEADRDGDGVADELDKCPDYNPGHVNDDGCPPSVTSPTRVLSIDETVLFATGKAEVLPSSTASLDAVARFLRDHPEVTRVRVEGHVDGSDAEAAKKSLSQDRANAVVKSLVKRGIAATRLQPHGLGAAAPVGDNATEDGRALNRRVAFTIRPDGAVGGIDVKVKDTGDAAAPTRATGPAVPKAQVELPPTTAPVIDRKNASTVVKNGQAGLQVCIDAATTHGAGFPEGAPGGKEVPAKVKLSLIIARDGNVAGATLNNTSLEQSVLGGCLIAAARRWKFAPPGEVTELELPLALR